VDQKFLAVRQTDQEAVDRLNIVGWDIAIEIRHDPV